jgi:hypothetical protein
MSERYDQETGEIINSLYRRSATLGELFGALAKAQAKIEAADKSGNNPHFNRKYATLGAVIEASREPMAENGLAVVQMPGNIEGNVAVTTILGHSSGEWIESTVYVAPAKFDAQGLGSVITYLRRYARMAIVGIAPEDDDGEAAVSRPATVAPRARTAPKPDPAALKAEEEHKAAQEAYRLLQGSIKLSAKEPEALRLLYNPKLKLWDPRFKADVDLVRKASPASLAELEQKVAELLAETNVLTEADAFKALDTAKGAS